MPKINLVCRVCQEKFERYPSQVLDVNKVCCSKSCNIIWLKENFSGNKNPNAGKKWSVEKRLKLSLHVKEQMKDPERRKICGNANRGKKFSTDRIKRMNQNRTFDSYSHPHSFESKQKISLKSKAKFTPNFKAKFRQTMEKKGFWIPKKDKHPYKLYCEQANWIEKMFDLRLCGIEFLEKLGVFNARSNRSGVVRDHRYSRREGFREEVFPELLRHPVNCQIITHSQNVSKSRKGIGTDCSLSRIELFKLIQEYKDSWSEHSKCLELIQLYEKGERYGKGE